MPSYNCCAARIVRCVENRNLRTASCCKVDVVNGGAGERLRCFFSTLLTVNCPCELTNKRSRKALACASLAISNCSNLRPSKVCKRALKACLAFSIHAVIVQYSWLTNFSICSSRSTIKRKAGLCTRPADKPCLILRHNNGDKLKPTK